MKLKIISPNKLLVDEDIAQVSLPGSLGELTVLPNHTFLLTELKKGKLRYPTNKGEERTIEISSGFAEIQNNEVTVLANIVF